MKVRRLKKTRHRVLNSKRYPGFIGIGAVLVAVLMIASMVGVSRADSVTYPDQALSGGFQAGHFGDVWDLTAGDMTISFTYDANGLVDDLYWNPYYVNPTTGEVGKWELAHAWAELGVRSVGSVDMDFNPYWRYDSIDIQKPLFVGQDSLLAEERDGNVIVKPDFLAKELFIKFKLPEDSPYDLVEVHVAVSETLEGIPQTKTGNPIPGKFPYGGLVDPIAKEFVVEVDASQWMTLSTIPTLYVAAHASVVTEVDGILVYDSAWAGKNPFSGENWATYFKWVPIKEEGSGVWLATDYLWEVNTFDPDPVGAPTLDMDDKLILQRKGGGWESSYNLPSVPPAPGANHRVWWDRDGVDPYQNPATANTGGIYQIVITLHATSDTTGTAYMNIRGLNQGFEVDGNWNTIELTPAGMTWVGDMQHLVVFYGMYGYGATHSVTFSDIVVTQ